ncbi:MAG: hypothetical protein DKINENOH_05629 [bacterium]|nr:hypothetical protein [bacterium]
MADGEIIYIPRILNEKGSFVVKVSSYLMNILRYLIMTIIVSFFTMVFVVIPICMLFFPEVIEKADSLLYRIGPHRSVESLIVALRGESEHSAEKHRIEYIRGEAAEALGKAGDKRAVEPLIAVLDDESDYLRRHAAEALSKIKDERAVPMLIPYLRDWYAGPAIAKALSRSGWHPTSVQDKVHFGVAKRDINSLKKMWDTTRQVLLEDLSTNNDNSIIIENAIHAFLAIGRKEIIPDLIDLFDRKGTRTMAEVYFYDSGNEQLRSAMARRYGVQYYYYQPAK